MMNNLYDQFQRSSADIGTIKQLIRYKSPVKNFEHLQKLNVKSKVDDHWEEKDFFENGDA